MIRKTIDDNMLILSKLINLTELDQQNSLKIY